MREQFHVLREFAGGAQRALRLHHHRVELARLALRDLGLIVGDRRARLGGDQVLAHAVERAFERIEPRARRRIGRVAQERRRGRDLRGQHVAAHEQIVELGNLVACNPWAMVELWGSAANDLGGTSEIAVATLTARLRRMFERVGIRLVELAPARSEALGHESAAWGRYYDDDPRVCAGMIKQGQDAIARFLSSRRRGVAA